MDTLSNNPKPCGTVTVRAYALSDLPEMTAIWNEVVQVGRAFPQDEPLNPQEAAAFFGSQSFTGIAELDGRVAGLYILHPNDIGRKAHIANASYAVRSDMRGCGIGRALVSHSLAQLQPCGFRGLQFNAVVASNLGAIHLYESLGFTRVGTIPGGYRNISGDYEDMHIFFHSA